MSRLNNTILSVATANPDKKYYQTELLEWFSLSKNSKIKKLFEHPHIQTRHLLLPPKDPTTSQPIEETTGQLLNKFTKEAIRMSGIAIHACLDDAGLTIKDVDFICVVTSTGFIIPGLTSLFLREFSLREDCQRVDVVGMGCHGGLNGLTATSDWAHANPGKVALLVCSEVCSAIYSIDDTARTAVVNSLFGDGTAAILMGTPRKKSKHNHARVIGFESHSIPEYYQSLRFDYDDVKHRYSFFVGKETPAALAAEAHKPLSRLLSKYSLKQEDIKHWILHTGGAEILNALTKNLGIEEHEIRHTRRVLREYGNISSGSFLFSYKYLMEENIAKPGEYGIMMTMGPGLAIEMALVQWD